MIETPSAASMAVVMRGADSPIPLVMCADDNMVMPLAVTVTSIAVNLAPGEQVTLYLFDGGIEQGNCERFNRMMERFVKSIYVIWVRFDPNQLAGLRGMEHLSLAAYLRLFIPSFLPPEVKKAVYLDCDLVVRASISQLYKIDFSGAPLLAARDQYVPNVSAPMAIPETYQLMGLSPDTPYFNSGVLVMNVQQWREQSIADAILEFLRTHSKVLRWADQDGLNAVLAGRVGLLDERWNYQYGAIATDQTLEMRQQRVRDSYIVHYTSRNKPWFAMMFDPERAEFLKYLRLSGWFGTLGFARFYASYIGAHLRLGYVQPMTIQIKKILKRAIKS